MGGSLCLSCLCTQALCKGISSFGPAFKEISRSWELVVTNCRCRMMGKLERDGFGEADQMLCQLLPHCIRNTHSNCHIWALSVFVPGNIQGQVIAGSPVGPALPSTQQCLSSVGGPAGQNASSAFGYYRHLTRF